MRPSNFCLHHQSRNTASTASPSITQSRSPDCLPLPGGAVRCYCCWQNYPLLPLSAWSHPCVASAAWRHYHFPSGGAAPGGIARHCCCPEGPVLPAARGPLLPVLVRANCRVSTTIDDSLPHLWHQTQKLESRILVFSIPDPLGMSVQSFSLSEFPCSNYAPLYTA